MKIIKFLIVLIALGAVLAGGYKLFSAQAKAPEGQAQGGAPQAMPVSVEIIKSQPVQMWKEFSARLEAVDYAEIRPQVGGIIKEVKFEDGQYVKQNDALYVIDRRPYQAIVNRVIADVDAAVNEAELAKKELDRAKNLIEADAISEKIYDERQNDVKIAEARAASAKAQLQTARINLGYATVKAPISGKVSRDEIKVGNLVEAGSNAPILTTIVSDEGIYADFEVDEKTYLKEIRTKTEGGDEKLIPVELITSDKTTIYKGAVQSFDNRIDTTSGTIRARAFFENENGVLLPGMFATVKMGSATPEDRIIVPEKAIGTDQDRKFVYVVDAENKVNYRPISIGDSVNGSRIVLSGLQEGDQVIVDGIIRIRPNMIVAPQVKSAMKEAPTDQTLPEAEPPAEELPAQE